MSARHPSTVVLVAATYPFHGGTEQTFLDREVEILAEEFERVVLAPEVVNGDPLPIPDRVEIDESLARELAALSRLRRLAHASKSALVVEELRHRGEALRSVTAMKRLLDFAGRAQAARRWAERTVRARSRRPGDLVFYTYWWGPITTGIGLARRDGWPRLVTRAHGFDLYEERHEPAYLPCRVRSVALLDALLPDSDEGRRYLEARYEASRRTRLVTARLGVRDPGSISPSSDDGVFRLVSCSFMVPVKRIALLIDGLARAASRRPAQRIEWTHFGTGPLHDDLVDRARRLLPDNVRWTFPGYSSQRDLLAWYGAHPVDAFANVSSSEGTPVAIMEAIACGIPVIATAVGGNPEIVGPDNGIRLPADPSPDDIADAIFCLADDPARARVMRERSRARWASDYDADRNFRAFAALLREVIDRP